MTTEATPLALARAALDRAIEAVTVEVEAEMTRAVIALSAEEHTEVALTSAMGTWTLDVGEEELESHPVLDLLQEMLTAYGWLVIPAPVCLTSSDGKTIHRLTEW